MKKNLYQQLAVLLLIGIMLAACTASGVPEAADPEPQVSELALAVQEHTQEADALVDANTEPTTIPEVRLPRENLEATDPATVVLASGQPQVVEFFAYW